MAGYIGTKAVLLSTTAASVTGTVTAGGLTVDTDTLHVDSANNRVGIGTASPAYTLDIAGGPHAYYDVGNSLGIFSASAGNDVNILARASQNLRLSAGGAERMRIDSTGNVGIGTTSPAYTLDVVSGTSNSQIARFTGTNTGRGLRIETADVSGFEDSAVIYDALSGVGIQVWKNTGTERMRIDSSGNLLVGKTVNDDTGAGFRVNSNFISSVGNGAISGYFHRLTSDGDIVQFRKDGTAVGSIASYLGSYLVVGSSGNSNDTYLAFANGVMKPATSTGADRDNAIDLGQSSSRFQDIFATNGTIQTSDANEKQQIAELTAAEMQAAKAISKLFKTFKWNDAVAEKGDDARIHTGVIAQEVEAALTAAGLDAGRYAFFISSTWWESTEVIPAVGAVEAVEATYDEEGNILTEAVEAVEAQPERTVTHTYYTAEEAPADAVERTRKGVRYPELLAFIGAATEQRLASIEARLDALETV